MNIDFPKRYVLAILTFLGLAMVYIMRANLSVTIVAMVNSSTNAIKDKNSTFLACRQLYFQLQNQTIVSRTETSGEFDWDRKTQSLILGAFFYGYMATQIPGGILAEKWSAKWLFGLGVFFTSILTLLSPIAARWSVQAFVAVRIMEGLAEGAMLPSMNTMIGRWVPKMERSRISTFTFSGVYIGNVISLSVSGFLSTSNIFGGWPSAFYIFGMMGCVWFMFWAFLIYERPEDHPRILPSELSYIRKDQANRTVMKIPWTSILTSVRVWALGITCFGQTWGFYTMISEMPTYLANVLHFNIEENGMLSSLPFILQCIVSWIAAYGADKMRENGCFTITTIRKLFNSIGFFGSGTCILLVAFVGCRPTISVALLCTAMGINGFALSGFKVTHVDMSPGLAGTLVGITTFMSSFSGFLAPYAVGRITTNGETVYNWGVVFGISATIFFITGIIYDIFCSAELQPWGEPSDLDIAASNADKKLSQSQVQKTC